MSGNEVRVPINVQVNEEAMHEAIRRFVHGERAKPQPESVTIPGVPTSIPRGLACDFIRALGLDPNGLNSLSFDPMGIHVEVYALNAEGHRFTADGENVAMHRMTIAIDDSPPKTAPTTETEAP